MKKLLGVQFRRGEHAMSQAWSCGDWWVTFRYKHVGSRNLTNVVLDPSWSTLANSWSSPREVAVASSHAAYDMADWSEARLRTIRCIPQFYLQW